MIKKNPFIHPFLFAIFPVLFLFSHNIKEASLSVILLPLLVLSTFFAVLLGFSMVIFKNREKAAIFTSFVLIIIFSYGHVLNLLRPLRAGGVGFGDLDLQFQHLFLLLTCVLLFGLTLYFIGRTRKNLRGLSSFMNIVALSLVSISLINVGLFMFASINSAPNNKEKNIETVGAAVPGVSPNVYYIIFDRYASLSTLNNSYDYANDQFLDDLARRGFYIAEKSVANYWVTILSLPSSLNLEYLENDKKFSPKRAIERMENNKVGRFFKSKGYKYVHIGSGWHPLSKNKYADINFNYYFPDEFFMYLYENSLFYPILSKLFNLDRRAQKHKRVLYTLDKLAQTSEIEGPIFVFAHFLIPHQPYIFDKDGNFVNRRDEARQGIKRAYLNQLIYCNTRIIEIIDKILANSKRPPIIVLQSDEGPYPLGKSFGDLKMGELSDVQLAEKMRILNAYYLPGAGKRALYPSISPVNSFRVIFNQYFNGRFDLLPDRSYAGSSMFKDVTNKVKY